MARIHLGEVPPIPDGVLRKRGSSSEACVALVAICLQAPSPWNS